MSFRLVSVGYGVRRAIVICYLVGAHLDDELRWALPGCVVVAYDDADGEPLEATVERARQETGAEIDAVALVGYSLGVGRGVRTQLRAGARVAAVVAVDGTHASVPPEPWQIDVWRDLAERARRGDVLFVATHTMQTYTERLSAPETPFLSTVSTLRLATGWELREGGPLESPVMQACGALFVYSYASAVIDGEAHKAQQRVVLPELLRRHLVAWLRVVDNPDLLPGAGDRDTKPENSEPVLRRGSSGPAVETWQACLHELGFDPGAIDGAFGPVTEHATRAFQLRAGLPRDGVVGPDTRAATDRWTPSARPTTPGGNLGLAVLGQARLDLLAGVREDLPGSNDGLRIREYFAGTGASTPAAWCAAALRTWLREATIATGIAAPVAGSVGAKAWMVQLQRAGRWFTADQLRANPSLLRSGMIPVWHRGPPGAWTGHIGVASAVDGRRFESFEGNSGSASERVAEMQHDLGDPALLGAGWVD